MDYSSIRPKIIVFSTSYFPYAGGAEVAIREIASRLTGDFDFFIITGRFSKTLPEREVVREGIVIRVGIGEKIDKFLLPFWGCFSGFLFLWRMQKEERKAIIWGMDISTGSIAAAFLKLLFPSIPLVFTIQYGEGDERLGSGRFGLIQFWFRCILGRANLVTAISSYLFETAKQYGYGGPMRMIHNGVDIARFAQTNRIYGDGSVPVVITTSRLVEKNGIGILIQAIAIVKKAIPEIKLHILGEGPLEKKLKNLVRQYDLEKAVEFFGTISHEQLPKFLSQARVFVRPSRSEGMGNSFVEALASGLPIIGTRVGGILDIIEDGKTGLFAKVGDPYDVAEKIIFLLKNKEHAQAIAKEGKKRVEEKFSWEKIANEFTGVFEDSLTALKILIATPLYSSKLGGPAFYARNLKKEFLLLGHPVSIASFGEYLKLPSGIRHIFYFFLVLKKGISADIIFALDQFSAGLPVLCASFILRRPYVLRLEGDFLWERYVENRKKDITLSDFYLNSPALSYIEKIIRWISGAVIKNASLVVFSSAWRQKMMCDFYALQQDKTVIVKNAWAPLVGVADAIPQKKIILWAGRVLYHKNLYRMLRAFAKVSRSPWEMHLVGDGPEKKNIENFVEKNGIKNVFFFASMPQDELRKKMQECEFLVLPTFSEVGPNIIADAVAASLPFIMTKESGYAEGLKEICLLVDPMLEMDLAGKIKNLMDDAVRANLRGHLGAFGGWRGWGETAKDWIFVFRKILKK